MVSNRKNNQNSTIQDYTKYQEKFDSFICQNNKGEKLNLVKADILKQIYRVKRLTRKR